LQLTSREVVWNHLQGLDGSIAIVIDGAHSYELTEVDRIKISPKYVTLGHDYYKAI